MEIRSVTLFCEASQSPAAFRPFFAAARHRFAVPVQSLRLGTTPFPDWLPAGRAGAAAADFAARWQAAGADYVSLGPVRLDDDPAWVEALPGILGAAGGLFASAEIATTDGRLSLDRCREVARLVRRVSTLSPPGMPGDGFGNLFLGALAGVGSGHPFLPASYAAPGPPSFALAVESADVALAAIRGAGTLDEARVALVAALEGIAAALVPPAAALAAEFGLRFDGLDLSLAPYPAAGKSLGGALEALGPAHVGAPGSLFAAAFITEAIGRARFPRAGFCGLMLPVLEDTVLAVRAAEGRLSLADLLSYAAVCGVGLDTVPLPGDIDEATLAGILLDTAALSARARKPLVARLMPLPGKAAGDPVAFDFPYFAAGRVMAPRGPGVGRLLAGVGAVSLNAYQEQ
jgi:hypothetical protein